MDTKGMYPVVLLWCYILQEWCGRRVSARWGLSGRHVCPDTWTTGPRWKAENDCHGSSQVLYHWFSLAN